LVRHHEVDLSVAVEVAERKIIDGPSHGLALVGESPVANSQKDGDVSRDLDRDDEVELAVTVEVGECERERARPLGCCDIDLRAERPVPLSRENGYCVDPSILHDSPRMTHHEVESSVAVEVGECERDGITTRLEVGLRTERAGGAQ